MGDQDLLDSMLNKETPFELQSLSLISRRWEGFSCAFVTFRPFISHICDTLTCLFIQSPGDGLTVFPQIELDDPYPPSFVDIIKEFLMLQRLEEITIIVPRRYVFDDQQLCTLADSWPSVRSLILAFPLQSGDSEPRVSLMGYVAKACPKLRHIELPRLGMEDPTTTSMPVQRGHPLTTIQLNFQDSWGSHDSSSDLIKQMLVAAFPNLKYYRRYRWYALIFHPRHISR